jgi:hypothetical protein
MYSVYVCGLREQPLFIHVVADGAQSLIKPPEWDLSITSLQEVCLHLFYSHVLFWYTIIISIKFSGMCTCTCTVSICLSVCLSETTLV